MKVDIPATVLGLVLALLVLLAGILGWKATHSSKSRFNFEDLLLDEQGRTSLYKCGQFTALVVSTWGFVYLTLAYKLSEAYFGLYMATWAGANVVNKWVEQKRERSGNGISDR